MTLPRDVKQTIDSSIDFKYIVECEQKTVMLKVEAEDIIYNADGEWDCPLDVVLTKNNYTLDDIVKWRGKYAHFVRIENGIEEIKKSIPLEDRL